MSSYSIVPIRKAATPPRSITVRTVATATRTPDLLVPAIIYVSLALAIYIVVRGDTAQIALTLPYLAGVLQILVRRAP